jgi:hypothetical protein
MMIGIGTPSSQRRIPRPTAVLLKKASNTGLVFLLLEQSRFEVEQENSHKSSIDEPAAIPE